MTAAPGLKETKTPRQQAMSAAMAITSLPSTERCCQTGLGTDHAEETGAQPRIVKAEQQQRETA